MDYQKMYSKKPSSYFGGENYHILKYVPDNLNLVLDVGCSSGGFGALLKERGIGVWGVEPNEEAALSASKKLDRVINSVFDETILDQLDVKFDCVFFIDVIEHLIDPESALNLCKKILKPNGYIVSAIPNILQYGTILNILKTQDWRYTDSGILDKTHFRFYSQKSILRLFNESGFTVLNNEGWYKKCSPLFKLLNFFLFNRIESMKYTHFITVVKY
ncbi:MAG: class I SAM-dependent methyltransferase [Haliscomenobacter sp.]|uniref:class I SAM-dependent methyltransferase n=1 Tax=Haliscomenobacter sp. TaxID=2717303 RepID=UPI0029BB6686|nr:class I SAM-dependent methyltransferase [Haliscomenobacter sp.]MDX2067864.1 class I SAM-dependent methyltransferase [Haliscomenobacter sp.]